MQLGSPYVQHTNMDSGSFAGSKDGKVRAWRGKRANSIIRSKSREVLTENSIIRSKSREGLSEFSITRSDSRDELTRNPIVRSNSRDGLTGYLSLPRSNRESDTYQPWQNRPLRSADKENNKSLQDSLDSITIHSSTNKSTYQSTTYLYRKSDSKSLGDLSILSTNSPEISIHFDDTDSQCSPSPTGTSFRADSKLSAYTEHSGDSTPRFASATPPIIRKTRNPVKLQPSLNTPALSSKTVMLKQRRLAPVLQRKPVIYKSAIEINCPQILPLHMLTDAEKTLERSFMRDHNPADYMYEIMAEEIGWNLNQVKLWYDRKKATWRSNEGLPDRVGSVKD